MTYDTTAAFRERQKMTLPRHGLVHKWMGQWSPSGASIGTGEPCAYRLYYGLPDSTRRYRTGRRCYFVLRKLVSRGRRQPWTRVKWPEELIRELARVLGHERPRP